MEDVKLLKKIEIFQKLTSFEIAKIGKLLKSKEYDKGDAVVKTGDAGESLFIVKKGSVKVTASDGGKEDLLATLGAGDHFGEVSLLDNQPRSADVIALEKSKLLEIKRKDLESLLSTDQDLSLKVYKAFTVALCRRLRGSNENLILLKRGKG